MLSLVLAVLLLSSFLVIEKRTPEPLMPLHLFSNRSRVGAYAVMLAIGTGIFSMFYFLTLYLQDILGFSALRTGLYYVPFAVMIMVSAGLAARLVGRFGPRLLIMAATLSAAGRLFWLSLAGPDSTYLAAVLGPMILIASGMACCFVPLTLTAVAGVAPREAGIAAALLNSGQQVGGSLGLAVLATVAATLTRSHLETLGPVARRIPAGAGPAFASQLPAALHRAVDHAFVAGYVAAFRLSTLVLLVAFVVAALTIRVEAPAGARAPATVAV